MSTSNAKKTVYVFGNPHLAYDNKAVQVAESLKSECKIVWSQNPEELFSTKEDELVILDVIKGITRPRLFSDHTQFLKNPASSTHDIDLSFVLNLMPALGITKKIKILGIPQEGNPKEFAKEVTPWLNS